jgi:transposase-like protein
MPQKTRISSEEKIAIVEACQQGKMGRTEAWRKLGVDKKTLRTWIMLYEARGREGLIPGSQNRRYSSGLKMQVVQEYLSGCTTNAHV